MTNRESNILSAKWQTFKQWNCYRCSNFWNKSTIQINMAAWIENKKHWEIHPFQVGCQIQVTNKHDWIKWCFHNKENLDEIVKKVGHIFCRVATNWHLAGKICQRTFYQKIFLCAKTDKTFRQLSEFKQFCRLHSMVALILEFHVEKLQKLSNKKIQKSYNWPVHSSFINKDLFRATML